MTRGHIMSNRLAEATLLDEHIEVTLRELCEVTRLSAAQLIDMVEEGLLEPQGSAPVEWRFPGTAVPRVRTCLRLQHDLGVNLAGASIIIDLLAELRDLRTRLERLEQGHS